MFRRRHSRHSGNEVGRGSLRVSLVEQSVKALGKQHGPRACGSSAPTPNLQRGPPCRTPFGNPGRFDERPGREGARNEPPKTSIDFSMAGSEENQQCEISMILERS